MTQDYISFIRSKVGHEKILLNFAGGILANEDGQVLLQLRGDKKTWAIPGGTMELGESSLETCKREFLEETGIAVEADALLNVYTNFEEIYPNGDAVQTVVFIYKLRAISDYNIADFSNEETLKLQFFFKEAIDHLDSLSVKHRLMLDEYFANDFKMGH